MKTTLQTENKIEVVGYVSNYKVKELSSGKKLAQIGIKDELTNNYTNVSLFGSDKLAYGKDDSGNRKKTTLGALNKIFMDGSKPRHVLVTAIGSCSEYYSEDKGKTYDNNIAFSLFPCDDEEKQKSIFHLTGFVVSTNSGADKNSEYMRLKIATYQTRGSYEERVVTGIQVKTVIARGKALEKLEDVEKGDFVKLDGDILNILPKRDRFGNFEGEGYKEYLVVVAKIVKSADEMEDEDVEFYKAARKLKDGKTLPYGQAPKGDKKKNKVKEVEEVEDDDEDLDF